MLEVDLVPRRAHAFIRLATELQSLAFPELPCSLAIFVFLQGYLTHRIAISLVKTTSQGLNLKWQ